MSASSRPVSVLVSAKPLENLECYTRIVAIGWRPSHPEYVTVEEGDLTRRRLLELLVAISSGVDIIYADCSAFEYKPIGEALLAYRWLLGDELKLVAPRPCCDIIPMVECGELPCG